MLLGGYFGAFAHTDEAWKVEIDQAAMRARGFALGCGVVSLVANAECGVNTASRIVTYMASQSARQCGPCVFGLTAIAQATARLAARRPQTDDLERIRRWSVQLTGRGACRHPDGAVQMMSSALRVFEDEFLAHSQGRCRNEQAQEAA